MGEKLNDPSEKIPLNLVVVSSGSGETRSRDVSCGSSPTKGERSLTAVRSALRSIAGPFNHDTNNS